MQKKEEIIRKCLENLSLIFQTLGKGADVEYDVKQMLVRIQVGSDTLEYSIDVRTVLKRPLSEHLGIHGREGGESHVLMAEYINPSIADDLIRQQINYVDCQGNAYLHSADKVLIHIGGKKHEIETVKEATTLFQPKGLQVLFILLADEGMLNLTVRELARCSAVSIGRIVSILRELKAQGYVRETGRKQLKLIRRKELFDNWLSNYGDRLRPNLILGGYKIAPSIENDLLTVLGRINQGKENSFAVSGNLGADRLIHYYRGKTTEIFVAPEMADTIRNELKLMPSKESDVTLFNLFSPEIIFEKGAVSIAHPLFIYAELLHRGGDRERETAKMIYDRYLRALFE